MNFEIYKNNPNLKVALQPHIESEGKPRRSIVGAISCMMINDASDELISLNRMSQDRSTPMSGALTLDRPSDLPSTAFAHIKELETMVVFGNVLIMVEDMIATGTYDHYAFTTGINSVFGSYGKGKIPEDPTEAPIALDKLKLKTIVGLASSDKSLAFFIDNAKILFPEKMFQTLEQMEMIPLLKVMASQYKEVYESMKPPEDEKSKEEEKEQQNMSLELLDNQLEKIIDQMENDPLQPRNQSKNY